MPTLGPVRESGELINRSTVNGYAVAQLDELDEISYEGCTLRPVRHHFGIRAFGVNAWTAPKAGDRLIPEHDEVDDGDEELYVVVAAAPSSSWTASATTHPPARSSSCGRREANGVRRGGRHGDPRGRRHAGKAYVGGGWELWAKLRPRYEAGEYEAIVDDARELAEDYPEDPTLTYNVACLEALTGRTADALEHLRRAIERADQFRDFAKGDTDLDSIRDEPAFRSSSAPERSGRNRLLRPNRVDPLEPALRAHALEQRARLVEQRLGLARRGRTRRATCRTRPAPVRDGRCARSSAPPRAPRRTRPPRRPPPRLRRPGARVRGLPRSAASASAPRPERCRRGQRAVLLPQARRGEQPRPQPIRAQSAALIHCSREASSCQASSSFLIPCGELSTQERDQCIREHRPASRSGDRSIRRDPAVSGPATRARLRRRRARSTPSRGSSTATIAFPVCTVPSGSVSSASANASSQSPFSKCSVTSAAPNHVK